MLVPAAQMVRTVQSMIVTHSSLRGDEYVFVFLERGKRKIVWWLVWGALAYLMRMKMKISEVCLGYFNAQGHWDLRPVIYMFLIKELGVKCA